MTPVEDMIDWYYRTSNTDVINTRMIGYNEYCVEIVNIYGDRVHAQTITIGRNQIAMIRNNYMHYQR